MNGLAPGVLQAVLVLDRRKLYGLRGPHVRSVSQLAHWAGPSVERRRSEFYIRSVPAGLRG
jgi:hypothetical protein